MTEKTDTVSTYRRPRRARRARIDPELRAVYTRVGSRLRELRERAGLSQLEVAERCFGSATFQGSISRWERGVFLPQIATLHRWAKFFGVSLADLGVFDPPETISPLHVARAVEHIEAAIPLLRLDRKAARSHLESALELLHP